MLGKNLIFFTIVFLANLTVGSAETVSELHECLNKQLFAFNYVLKTIPENSQPTEMEYLQNFWLRVRLPVRFTPVGFLSVSIVPEIEILFRRDLPEGSSPVQ